MSVLFSYSSELDGFVTWFMDSKISIRQQNGSNSTESWGIKPWFWWCKTRAQPHVERAKYCRVRAPLLKSRGCLQILTNTCVLCFSHNTVRSFLANMFYGFYRPAFLLLRCCESADYNLELLQKFWGFFKDELLHLFESCNFYSCWES